MKRLALAAAAVFYLTGCATDSVVMQLPPPEGLPQQDQSHSQVLPPLAPSQKGLSIAEIQTQLGLNRSPQDLGFQEARFNGCQLGLKGDNSRCGERYLSVVHFRLVCRDSVGSTSRVPASLKPLASHGMNWRLAGTKGLTRTDSEGFGQVQMISSFPTKAERFILIIGSKTLGVEAGEVSQIVLPGNWCPNWAGMILEPIFDVRN